MSTHPHTIDNGAGERLTFVAIRRDDRGEYIECRNSVAPGAGPPMHVHHLQEEGLTVERGTIGYQSEGGPEHTAGPGESVTFAPGEAHRFWNAGDDELVCTGFVRPPGNLEYFLTEMYASMRRNGGDRPGIFAGAHLGLRYRREFEITEVPTPVRRLVFSVVAAAGRLLGLRRRFADAPEPVTPSDTRGDRDCTAGRGRADTPPSRAPGAHEPPRRLALGVQTRHHAPVFARMTAKESG